MFVETTIPDAPPLPEPVIPPWPADLDPVETLRRARQRISRPDRWTTGAEARSVSGRSVIAWQPSAVSWCAFGAVLAEANEKGVDVFMAMRLLSLTLGTVETVIEYNDTPPRYYRWMGVRRLRAAQHRRVLRLFDEAIAGS